MGGTCNLFSAIFPFALLQSRARIFMFISKYSVKLLYSNLKNYQIVPYPKKLPNYTLSQFITELYPVRIQYPIIFPLVIESHQYLQALKITAGVRISPRRNGDLQRRACNKKPKKFSEQSHNGQKESFRPLPIFIH